MLDVSAVPDPKCDYNALSGIPEWRRRYILRYMRACDRKLSLGAWRLLDKALKENGFSSENVMIGRNGKPECDGIYFNLSHSADMALCVVCDTPVGCDIEKVTTAPMEVAERYFSKREYRYISDAENRTDADRRFFRLWTMKESYMKMTGEGMSISPDSIEMNVDVRTVMRDGVLQDCILQNTSVGGYEISICVSKI